MGNLLVLLAAHAAAGPLALEEARSLAAEQALAVRSAEQDSEAARAASLLALSAGLPEISAFASVSVGAGLTAFGFPRPVATQAGVGGSARWTLVAPSIWAGAAAARHGAKGAAAMLDWAVIVARRDATIRFAEATSALATRDALISASEDARRAAAAVAALAESGMRPEADAARASAAAAALDARLRTAEGEVVATCAELQSLVGLPIDGRCELVIAPWPAPEEGPARHPALVAAEEALDAARSQRSATWLDRAGAISADATAAEYVVTGGQPGLGWSANLRADVPLVSSGAGIARLSASTAARTQAEIDLEVQGRALAVAALAARARYDSAVAAQEAAVQAHEAAQLALLLVETRYREGLESLEAWLSARRTRDEALVALAVQQAAVGASLAALEEVRGVR